MTTLVSRDDVFFVRAPRGCLRCGHVCPYCCWCHIFQARAGSPRELRHAILNRADWEISCLIVLPLEAANKSDRYSDADYTQIPRARDHWPSLIARFMGLKWGPSGADRTQVGPMLAPWTLLSELSLYIDDISRYENSHYTDGSEIKFYGNSYTGKMVH